MLGTKRKLDQDPDGTTLYRSQIYGQKYQAIAPSHPRTSFTFGHYQHDQSQSAKTPPQTLCHKSVENSGQSLANVPNLSIPFTAIKSPTIEPPSNFCNASSAAVETFRAPKAVHAEANSDCSPGTSELVPSAASTITRDDKSDVSAISPAGSKAFGFTKSTPHTEPNVSTSARNIDPGGPGEYQPARASCKSPRRRGSKKNGQDAEATRSSLCGVCARESTTTGSDTVPWIECDHCATWFHCMCVGLEDDKRVREINKFRCSICEPLFGPTSFVRKSSRKHTQLDYAGLDQGILQSSEEKGEHHYLHQIKSGERTFLPDVFMRISPQLLDADFFEKGMGISEPIIVPEESPLNGTRTAQDTVSRSQSSCEGLDLMVPKGLTVRMVADLHGREEKVEVIDVKTQDGENEKWTLGRWADYYEDQDQEKAIRNVISLEVSRSVLGRLIKRPRVVRELDLQDSVWPKSAIAQGDYPHIQYYCLMSVKDCFTDFHVDFGGSSVFYHILEGQKTFFFIPPKDKNLRKYEEWCTSPNQHNIFLPDETQECYRVDLQAGDTMLIPSGWIHAVWTPEDSLVLGGNFLTRLELALQLRISRIERSTGVARRFQYPHFHRLQWYVALQYLREDPVPDAVAARLRAGLVFVRERPLYDDTTLSFCGEKGSELYNARYYSQSELNGVPDLCQLLLRAALLDLGHDLIGHNLETRSHIRKSIPRGYGNSLDIARRFAVWVAWKRGNEPLPDLFWFSSP